MAGEAGAQIEDVKCIGILSWGMTTHRSKFHPLREAKHQRYGAQGKAASDSASWTTSLATAGAEPAEYLKQFLLESGYESKGEATLGSTRSIKDDVQLGQDLDELVNTLRRADRTLPAAEKRTKAAEDAEPPPPSARPPPTPPPPETARSGNEDFAAEVKSAASRRAAEPGRGPVQWRGGELWWCTTHHHPPPLTTVHHHSPPPARNTRRGTLL